MVTAFLLFLAVIALSFLIAFGVHCRVTLFGQIWRYGDGDRRWVRAKTNGRYYRWSRAVRVLPFVYFPVPNVPVMLLDGEGFRRHWGW